MNRPATTAALRPPTGLDDGARQIILQHVWGTGATGDALEAAFYQHEAWADRSDYVRGLGAARGEEVATEFLSNTRSQLEALVRAGRAADLHDATDRFASKAIFLAMPEPDFLTAVERGVAEFASPFEKQAVPAKINRACEQRGVPYRLGGSPMEPIFEWVGDAVIEEEVVRPALAAIDDPRLAGGPRDEFEEARRQLRQATPASRKLAVGEACSAVESAMKVLCAERGVGLPSPAGAKNLHDALVEGGVLPQETDQMILGPSRFGNKRGRHGAGAVAHDVSREEAGAVVASAAVAITYLAGCLPASG